MKETETQRNTNLVKTITCTETLETEKRPEHCIIERYIENQRKAPKMKFIPGKGSFASTTDYGKKIFVVGDSHMKRIKRKRFNNLFEKAKSLIKSFPRTKLQELEYYVAPHLNAQKQMYQLYALETAI